MKQWHNLRHFISGKSERLLYLWRVDVVEQLQDWTETCITKEMCKVNGAVALMEQC